MGEQVSEQKPYFDPNRVPTPLESAVKDLRAWTLTTTSNNGMVAAVNLVLDELARVTSERDRLLGFRDAIVSCLVDVKVAL